MSEYNAYGELYDRRPELIIHNRLKNSGSMMQVIEIAHEMNFKIKYSQGPFRQDIQINWHESDNKKPENYSMYNGFKYLQKMKESGQYQ